MKKPPIPANEATRLASLKKLDILDTGTEERFDRITRVAKAHFGVAIALVSLVDENRQWFKSCQGLNAKETPRGISFCGHAILSDEILIINNAVENPDFADNPLVTGPPKIRFYAGAPLHAPGGERVGTLCIIDQHPRDLTIEERATLRDLADWAETELAFARVLAAERETVEANYRGQIEAINRSQMIIEFDMDGTIIRVNENYLRTLGYTEAEVKGKNHRFFISEQHSNSGEYKDFWDGLRAGKFRSGEFCRIGKNGREVWLEASYNPILGIDGIPVRVVKIATDVTEKVEARCKFRDAETRLRAIFDSVVDGIITINEIGNIVSVNQALLNIFRYDEYEVIGKNINILMPEPHHSVHDGYVAHYQSKTGSNIIGVGREMEGLTKENRKFPIELTVTEVTLHGKRYFVGLIRDITERKENENALRTSQARLSMAMDLAQLVQWEYDVAANVFIFDDKFYALYGTSAEQEGDSFMPSGVYAREFVHPDETGIVADAINKAMASEGEYSAQLEHRIIRRDGEVRHIVVRFMVVRNESGNIVKFFGANQDITERKQVEQKLRNAYQLISNDLESAATIQKNLLPPPSIINGTCFEWLFCPSSFVAGDIFNYFQIDEYQVGFYLLDVSGHGVPAAMLSVSMSWMISNMLQNENNNSDKVTRQQMMSPSKVLGKLNSVFQENRTAGQYVTMIYGVLNSRANCLTISQAGLPAPIFCNPSGSSSVIGNGGFPIGLFPDVLYEEETIDFYPGDRFFLYSDGITECFNAKSIQFSDEQLVSLIEAGASEQLGNLLESVDNKLRLWRGNTPFDDDVTLLAIERRRV